MIRRTALLLLAGGLTAMTLSACTSLAPVYGDMSATGMAAARFNFAEPRNRYEQIILQRLRIAFPGPASATDPVLTVSATTFGASGVLSNAISVAAPVHTGVEATVTVTQDGQNLFEARRFTNTGYQGGKLTPNDLASAAGAYETAAESTAEALRAAILAGYRPGTVSTPQR